MCYLMEMLDSGRWIQQVYYTLTPLQHVRNMMEHYHRKHGKSMRIRQIDPDAHPDDRDRVILALFVDPPTCDWRADGF